MHRLPLLRLNLALTPLVQPLLAVVCGVLVSPRRKLLAAIAIGVVLAGPPVAALNIWLGGLVERQGREELDLAGRRHMVLSERALPARWRPSTSLRPVASIPAASLTSMRSVRPPSAPRRSKSFRSSPPMAARCAPTSATNRSSAKSSRPSRCRPAAATCSNSCVLAGNPLSGSASAAPGQATAMVSRRSFRRRCSCRSFRPRAGR